MSRTFSRQCPQCSQRATWPDTPTYPFCSERCQLIDLGVWAHGDYRIPTDEGEDNEGLAEAWDESEDVC